MAVELLARCELHAMKFSIEVGTDEKHTLEFSFNQLLGRSLVKVDGAEILKKKRWFSEPLVDRYKFRIGQFERIHICIEKQRKLLFASKYCVYLNNRLTQFYQGF
jgi:hypothetical protein